MKTGNKIDFIVNDNILIEVYDAGMPYPLPDNTDCRCTASVVGWKENCQMVGVGATMYEAANNLYELIGLTEEQIQSAQIEKWSSHTNIFIMRDPEFSPLSVPNETFRIDAVHSERARCKRCGTEKFVEEIQFGLCFFCAREVENESTN